MPEAKNTLSPEATGSRILDAALELFRHDGFEATTMRQIAAKAEVATGAAYYYYPSKEAIVMEFYERASAAMQPALRQAVESARTLESGLVHVIQVKLSRFAPNRVVLRALLRNGADPSHPLSPFSAETRAIRDLDTAWFERLTARSTRTIPRDIAPVLPSVLWFFQMGIILFWVTDDSPQQQRTATLLPLACRIVATMVRLSALPLMRRLRKPVILLIQVVTGPQQ